MENKNKKNESSKSSPLLIVLVLTNTLFVGFLLYKQSQLNELTDQVISEKTEVVESDSHSGQNSFHLEPKEGNILEEFPIESLTVNLARPSGPQRFITLSMVLILETPQDKPTDEMTNKIPTFRDEIIDILNTKTPQEILKLEGREVLKNIIKNHLNQSLKSDKVRRILFTQFKVS